MSEKQLTFRARHHQLTNINAWTADSQWIVFDVRPSPSIFTSRTVERVNISSLQTEVLWQGRRGAHVGVITAHPVLPSCYICICGPEDPDEQWQYAAHHRRGLIINAGATTNMDACDITPPFTPGALRGGSHVHVFSADGSRISFTYDDHVLQQYRPSNAQRNVGVAVPLCPVTPRSRHPRQYSGDYFCVLISQTTSRPRWGSDEIDRAYEEGWIGKRGYQRADGTWQRWAIAFIGDTYTQYGEKRAEVFIVDLPERLADYARAGSAPLEGTLQQLPAPPLGVKQRRLTYSRGLAQSPRHWLRTTPDGGKILFLMQDSGDVVQLWSVPTLGGEPTQITRFTQVGIQSAFTLSPDGRYVAFVANNTITCCEIEQGHCKPLTAPSEIAPASEAVVWSPDGNHIAYMREKAGWRQLFIVAAT